MLCRCVVKKNRGKCVSLVYPTSAESGHQVSEYGMIDSITKAYKFKQASDCIFPFDVLLGILRSDEDADLPLQILHTKQGRMRWEMEFSMHYFAEVLKVCTHSVKFFIVKFLEILHQIIKLIDLQ